MESKRFNFNSFLGIVILAGGGVISWLGNQQLSDIKDNIRAVRSEMIPRQEVQVQIADVKERLLDLDARLKVLELESRKTIRTK